MANKSLDKKNDTIRTSISLTKNNYEELEKIAYDKKVSLAWVVREAIDNYLSTKNENFED